jgi:hypothetical protein
VALSFEWRGAFFNAEVNELHADAFDHARFDDDWQQLVARHSLGWATARLDGELVGFVNVVWDGLVHAWLQDTMVSSRVRHRGIGSGLIGVARSGASDAGCEWLHVDFDEDLAPFYLDAAGFRPTSAGLINLKRP